MINNYSGSPYTFEYTELTKFSEIDIKKYCDCIKNNFSKEIPSWSIEKNTYWTTRFYIAVKYIYSSSILISSLEHAENTNLQIVIPYLTYYSLLTCSRLAILTSPISLDSIKNLINYPHSKIINVATDLINKLNLKTGKEYKKLIATCKANRELFSYKFPASGLDLIKSNKNVTDSYYRYCRLLCELAQLNSTILDVLLNSKGGEFEIDGNYDSLFYSCFEYKGLIDNEDYYRAGYISRNIKRPRPLDALMSIGMTEDFFGSWCNQDIEEYENYQYNPDKHTQILFSLP